MAIWNLTKILKSAVFFLFRTAAQLTGHFSHKLMHILKEFEQCELGNGAQQPPQFLGENLYSFLLPNFKNPIFGMDSFYSIPFCSIFPNKIIKNNSYPLSNNVVP
jgi:hypothetical protein